MNERLTEEFSFEVRERVDINDIAKLLTTAFDGNMVSCWSPNADTHLPDDFDIDKVPWMEDPEEWRDVRKCYIAPLVPGGYVMLYDVEDDNKPYKLDLVAINRGIRIMSEKYYSHWSDFRKEDDDAITGDVFVQCCVFGDVIYG